MGAGYEEVEHPAPVLAMERTIFPSPTQPALCERYLIRNIGSQTLEISIPEFSQIVTTPSERGITGGYVIRAELLDAGIRILQPGDSTVVDALFRACRVGETLPPADVGAELRSRREFVSAISDKLVLETPDPVVDTEFRFAKIRAAESIIKTRGGYMHAPGGECYYAAIWANDQAEYVNPFFPMLGYDIGNRSALNAFRHFARFMNAEYRPIPSSIIAEGDDIWNGAGDRGDAAMIAYGAARYALARGERNEAEELWPLVEWCLEYCRRKLTPEGVVASDTDELEGRFPAGKANLCTSTLYYDALRSAVYLGQELGCPRETLRVYKRQTSELAEAIECHFGATVAGYETYRYFDGCTKLRSWICMPLIAGLQNRSEGTPHRTGQFDLLGPFDPLCSAGNLHRRAGRPCNGIPQSLCPAQTPGRSCSLSDRSMARGLSTPLGRRKRAFLPRYHRGIVRDSPHRVQELRSYPFNAFRMESHGVLTRIQFAANLLRYHH